MSSNKSRKGRNKGGNKGGNKNQPDQIPQVNPPQLEKTELTGDPTQHPDPSLDVALEKKETESTQQGNSNTDVSHLDEPSTKQNDVSNTEHSQVEVTAQPNQSQEVSSLPKVDQSEPLPAQAESPQIQNKQELEPQGPVQTIQKVNDQVQKNVDYPEAKLNQAKIENNLQNSEVDHFQNDRADTTVIQVLNSGEFTHLAESASIQPNSKPSSQIIEEKSIDIEKNQKEEAQVPNQENNHHEAEVKTEQLVGRKQATQNQVHPHQQSLPSGDPQPEAMILPIVKKKEPEQQSYFFQIRESLGQSQPVATEDIQENNHNQIPRSEPGEPSREQENKQEQPAVHQNTQQDHQAQKKKPAEAKQIQQPRIIYKSEQISVEDNQSDSAPPVRSDISGSNEAVIDLNKPIDQDSPKTNTKQRLFTLVQSNEISINQSNEIPIADSLEVKKQSAQVTIPVKESLSFSDLNYSAEKSGSVSQEHPHEEPLHVDPIKVEYAQDVQHTLTASLPVETVGTCIPDSQPNSVEPIKVEHVQEVQHNLTASLPIDTIGTCVPKTEAASELFYSIVDHNDEVEKDPVQQQVIKIEESAESKPEVLKLQAVEKSLESNHQEPASIVILQHIHEAKEVQKQAEPQNPLEIDQSEAAILPAPAVEPVVEFVHVPEKVLEPVAVAASPPPDHEHHKSENELSEPIDVSQKIQNEKKPVQKLAEDLSQRSSACAPRKKQPENPVQKEADDLSEESVLVPRKAQHQVIDPQTNNKKPEKPGMSNSTKAIISTVVGVAVGGAALYLKNDKLKSLAFAGISTAGTFILSLIV